MNTIKNEIAQRLEIIPNGKRPEEDADWLESDLSDLDKYDPYEWQEGELQEGLPVKFIVETGKIEIALLN